MFEIITHDEKDRWDSMVASFPNHDVYYMHGYVAAFKIHGDGEPLLLYYDDGTMRGIYVAMLRDIAESQHLKGLIPKGELFDLISPYGYGGFIFEGDISNSSIRQMAIELEEMMAENNIVSCFTRFSPILNNAQYSRTFVDVIDLGKTIALDLSSHEIIWENITSKNRNMIRKAHKNGVEIFHTHEDFNLLLSFREMYNTTMKQDCAESYYFFPVEFYESIYHDLKGNYELFYAIINNKVISMAIMLHANGKMHYHLSASDFSYRKYAPSNLLLYEAALWGSEQGFKVFHLGGGLGSEEDSLYKFKAAFNRNSNYQFSIGKQIFNQQEYDKLVKLRELNDNENNNNNSHFPMYRK